MNILSLDIGFSNVKIAYYSPESGELILEKEINAIAKLPGPPDSLDDKNCFSLNESYYVMSSSALKLPRSYHLVVSNYETMREVTPIWISYLLHNYEEELGITFDKVAIGLSIAYKDKADDLLQYISNQLLMPMDFFVVLPQGVAAKTCLQTYGLSLDPSKRGNYKFESIVLADIGSNTADIALIMSGMSSTASAIGLENSGVCKVLYDIQSYIFKATGKQISRSEAEVVMMSGNWRSKGRNYDLSKVIHDITLRYLINDVLDLFDKDPKISELIENVDRVVLIGGGGNIWRQFLPELQEEIQSRGYPKEFFVSPERDAEYFNAISYLLIAKKKFEEN